MTTRLFFNGSNAGSIPGLWVTDGTDAGTTEIAVTGSYAGGLNPSYMVSFNNKLYFYGISDPYGNPVLWSSDGTTAGTTQLVISGADANFFPYYLTVAGGKLYFSGWDNNGDANLWVSDGTAAGTVELTASGQAIGSLTPDNLVAFNDMLYFQGIDSGGLHGMWVSDGTNAGTVELAVTGASASQGLHPSDTVVFAGSLYFSGIDASEHTNLWLSGGSANFTNEWTVTGQSANGLNPTALTAVGSKLFFNGVDAGGLNGLWVSDGSEGGTSELTVTGASITGLNPHDMVAFNGKLYFSGSDTNGNVGLWESDGTNAGTVELTLAQQDPGGLDASSLAVFSGKLYFSGDGPSDNTDLWVSDGTAGGTQVLNPANARSFGIAPQHLTGATVATPAPLALTLSPTSDTGTLGDDLTSVNTPVITGTGIAGDMITLFDTDGMTPVGSAVVGVDGNWSVTASALTNGLHTLTAKQTDVDTTISVASAALALTIDTPPPVAPVDLILAPATDSGALGDHITNFTALAVIGTGIPGDTVTLYDTDGTTPVGTAVVDNGGTWVITTSALTNGIHNLTAKQADGNSTSVASAALVLRIDSVEARPSGLTLAPASDTGPQDDHITSITTPVINGLGIAGDTVTLYEGMTVLGTAVVGENGHWSITSSRLSGGIHTLTATQSDAAGNVSVTSVPMTLTISTLTAGLVPNPHNGNGIVYNDLLDGDANPNATVTISDNGTVIGTAQSDANGAWTFDLASLGAGAHALTASETEIGGHVTTSDVIPLTVAPHVVPDTRFSLTTVGLGSSDLFFGSDYSGAAGSYLQAEYGYNGTENVFVIANVANVFIYGGTEGQDVIMAHSGSNVLDARSGSNWMVGATGEDGGTDTFFVDNHSGTVAWSTLLNFHAGDMLTLWGYDPTAGSMQFTDDLGASGYHGATLQATLGNGTGDVDLVTFQGLSAATAQFTTSTGTAGGVNYLAVTRIA